MPKTITAGRINRADVTSTLDPEVDITSSDGLPLRARRLFMTLERRDGPWRITKLEVSAAKPAPRVGGYSTLYLKTSDFRLEGRIKEVVDGIVEAVKTDAENRG